MTPIIWSIAGTDSGGGAGLSADQRAADAFGVHLCPVVAAVTAQSTTTVTRIEAVPPELLDSQLAALAEEFAALAREHLQVIAGDFGSPALGLDAATWSELAGRVDRDGVGTRSGGAGRDPAESSGYSFIKSLPAEHIGRESSR